MSKYILLLTLFLVPLFVLAKDPLLISSGKSTPEIDSLEATINPKIVDITLLEQYNDLVVLYRHIDAAVGCEYAKKAIAIHDKVDNPNKHQETYNRLGNIFFDQGYYYTATKYYKQCLDISLREKEFGAAAYAYNDIGHAHRRAENPDKALEYFEKAANLADRVHNDEVLAHSYSNISLVNISQSRYDEALIAAEKAQSIYKELPLKTDDYFRCKSYIALNYSGMENYEKAARVLDTIFNNYQPTDKGDSLLLASIYRFSFNIYFRWGEYDQALRFANEGLKLAKITGYNMEKAIIYNSLGAAYSHAKDTTNAIKSLQHSLEISEENGYLLEMLEALEGLTKIGASLPEDDQLSYFRKFFKVNKEYEEELLDNKLKTFDYEIEVSALEIKNELLNAEREASNNLIFGITGVIILLGILVVAILIFYKKRQGLYLQIENTYADLEKSLQGQRDLNKTKDKFFTIIAHDLKNPLGGFNQSIEMLSENYESFTDEERKAFLYELQKTSIGLKILLEDLLTWSLSQTGKIPFNPSNTSLQALVDDIFRSLASQSSQKNILLVSIELEAAQVFVDSGMFKTILLNTVSNAIKFTFEGGRVAIYHDTIADNDIITVKDTGVGMTDEKLEDIFNLSTHNSTLGTRGEKGTGLGLVLTKEFIERHGGDIRAESKLGSGTSIIMRFPKEKHS